MVTMLLAIVLAGSGEAATIPSAADSDAVTAEVPVQSTMAPPVASRATAQRLIQQGVLGSIAAVGGSIAGGYLGAGASCALDPGDLCALGGLIGIFPGALLGASLGVHWTGALLGGRGAFWGTILGSAIGLGAGLGAAYLINLGVGGTPPGLLLAVAVIPILTGVGGLAGYEKSAGARARAVLLTPMVTSDRAGLALAGSF